MPIVPCGRVAVEGDREPRIGDFIIYPRLGNPSDDPLPPRGPGLILSGGHGHVGDAYRWMHRVITGGRRGGDIVVIRATPDDTYSASIMQCAPFNSVQTICVPEDATEEQLAEAAAIVGRAEGVFFAGGQQSRYVAWKGSSMIEAVQKVYDQGGVVGGTSAGLAILGEHIFDGKRARSSEVTSRALVADPDTGAATFTKDLFEFTPLSGCMTDTHFQERDRFGRLVTFLSRTDAPKVLGVGVDEETAMCIDGSGVGHIERIHPNEGNVYLIECRGDGVRPDRPLGPVRTRVTRIDDPSERFDFSAWTGDGDVYEVVVTGHGRGMYSVNPYTGR